MTTVTISLPAQIAQKVDIEAKSHGFATRSEFMRTLLRRYFAGELEFETFSSCPISEVKLELAKTGRYSEEFI
jgi:Arc/MetJ-type ribon-helix-helix transcriptional regulator